MLQNFSTSADNGNEFMGLSTNLTEVFDFVDHKILIAKLFLYKDLPTALNLIHSYLLTNRNQKINIKNSFSRRRSIECSVPTAQKMTFSVKDFFSKCDQIRRLIS